MALTLKTCRRTSQLLVAGLFVVVAWQQETLHDWARGNLLSFHLLGLPLADPLAALQVMAGSWSLPGDMLAGLLIALALAALLGPVFCSWACPFGLLSEMAHDLRFRLIGGGGRASAQAGAGFLFKAALGGLLLAIVLAMGWPPLLNQLSLPGWYSRLWQTWFGQGHWSGGWLLIAGILAIEALASRRLWCRYLCPQSLLLMIVHHLVPGGLRLRFSPSACICKGGPDACAAACTLGLNPRRPGPGLRQECNNCGDCVGACKKRGQALSLAFNSAKQMGKE